MPDEVRLLNLHPDCLAEVLVESSVTALVGGVAGLAAAVAVLSLASRGFGIDLPLERATVVASLAAASFAGVVAGWIPARRASRVDVIAALRLE